uniref:YadA-like family protein n=1 Tax=Escherichia coli TaxID=562 RepID=UPI00301414C7
KIGGGGGMNMAIGNNATVDNVAVATAIGNRATVTAVNSVALGYGSVADRAETVSVGGNGTKRQITNVAAGTVGTDAVNVNQLNDKAAETLKSANEYSTQQITNAAQTANDRATHLETRADTSEQNIRDVQGAAQTANDRASTLETRADSSEQAIRDVQGAAQTANDRASTLETRADGVEAVNAQQDSTLADHDTRITSNTSALNTKVDKQVFADDQARQDAALKSETTTRTSQVAKLQSGVDQAQATGDYANSRIDVANQNIEANRQASIATNKRVAANTAQLANHEQRITTLEQNTSARFSDLNKQIDDNRKRASAGIAGVAAMANIPQVLEHQTFAIGAGAGNTDGESALAVGFSARASQNTVVKASVSNDTQHNFVVGAGVAFGW